MMNIFRIIRIIGCIALQVLVTAGISVGAPWDYCEVHEKAQPRLCSYEPTTIGYTKDSDDTGFMDFKLSVRYQLFPNWLTQGQNWIADGLGDNTALYMAFTGRFGQYIGTRHSSPVVEKLFNPKLFYRIWIDEGHDSYLDFGFAHQSNGQSIDSRQEYDAALAAGRSDHEVKDQISRGWDYGEVVWKQTLYEPAIAAPERQSHSERQTGACTEKDCIKDDDEVFCRKTCNDCASCRGRSRRKRWKTSVVSYLGIKYFLQNGPLQGPQENYTAWENDSEGKPLDRVSGLSVMIKWTERDDLNFLSDLKVVLRLETGIRKTFRYRTYRLEAGTKIFQLPMIVWVQSGYNSDFAQYYKKVDSYGIQAEIGSF